MKKESSNMPTFPKGKARNTPTFNLVHMLHTLSNNEEGAIETISLNTKRYVDETFVVDDGNFGQIAEAAKSRYDYNFGSGFYFEHIGKTHTSKEKRFTGEKPYIFITGSNIASGEIKPLIISVLIKKEVDKGGE